MAFPTTCILDKFNRADENPLSNGGKWSNPLIAGETSLQVISNTCRPNGPSSASSNWWSDASFGADTEVFITVSTAGAAADYVGITVRTVNENSASLDGYILYVTFPSTWQFFRLDNGAFTQLGANVTQTVASGDAMGLSIVGTTLTAYYKASGGSWVSLNTRTDSTYTAAGHIGIDEKSAGPTTILDDFGGGTVVAGGAPPIVFGDEGGLMTQVT